MEVILIVLGIVLVVSILVYILNKISVEDQKKTLRFAYGNSEDLSYDMHYYENVDNYYKSKLPKRFLDNQSFKDLDLMKVYKTINRAQSSIGDEYFYSCLRNQERIQTPNEFEDELAKYDQNEKLRISHQLAFQKLGKHEKHELFSFINLEGSYKMPEINRHKAQAILAIIALILIPINLPLGILSVSIMFAVNQITFFAMKKESTQRFLILKNYANMIFTAKKTQESNDSEKFKLAIKDLNKVGLYSSFLASDSGFDITGVGMLTSIISAYFMTHILAYNTILKIREDNQANSIVIYETLGYKEMCISVASYRKSLTYYSLPNFKEDNTLSFRELYHPLVENPVSYTHDIEDKLLITGSNASGKSTFVKSLAINTILSKVINTSLSKEFNLRPYFVQTSMAISDDVETGDSYFIAEIKSIKNLLETVKDEPHSMIIIDEVLKGTNTIERIAASSAVLEYLSESSSFVCAASHDIEMTKILQHCYVNYHFRENIEVDGISFDYQLHQGPSITKNAIKLLGILNYPEEIIINANTMAKGFEKTNRWEYFLEKI